MEEWLLQSIAREREQLHELEARLPEWLDEKLRQSREESASQSRELSPKTSFTRLT